jgi:hypothetical protein
VRALVLGLLAALAVAVGVSGCGAEDVDPATIAEAAEATSSAGGAKLSLEGEATVVGRTIDIAGSGVMDEQGNSRIVSSAAGAGEMTQVFTKDFVMYQRMPGVEEQFGKEWTKVDMIEANRRNGIDLTLVQGAGGNDPRQMLSQLKASAEEIEELGDEEVRGVNTTHYRAEIDPRNVDHLPAEKREAGRKSAERLIEMTGVKRTPLEVWIGDDKLLRRLRLKMTLNNPAFGGRMDMDMTMELYDYGSRVSIEVPKDDEAKDLTDFVADMTSRMNAP